MTRPKDLPSALQSWANANYSAGPSWGGTPQRSAPGATFLTPGITLPAEVANYLHGNAFDVVQGCANAVGQLPALNWSAPVTVGGTTKQFAYSDYEQAWYAIQAASTSAFKSLDFGKTYSGITLAVASAAYDIAFDQAGNGVICGGANVQQAPFVSYGTPLVWTNSAAVVTAFTNRSTVAFEPTSGLWCIVGAITSTSAAVWTSTNRTAWTSRTIPATWSTLPTIGNITIGVGNSLLVASYVDSATTFRTMRSADGGITWTNDQAITVNAGISLGTGAQTKPVWSAVDALWYIAVNQTGTRRSQVFSSPDAITWTSAVYLAANDCAFQGLVALGALIVAVNDDGRIFASFNKGVNWWRCGTTGLSVIASGIKSGGGGILIAGPTTNAVSSRFGLPTMAA